MIVAKKMALFVLTSAFLAGGLCACDSRDNTAGERLDTALEKTGEKVKEAGEAIKPE